MRFASEKTPAPALNTHNADLSEQRKRKKKTILVSLWQHRKFSLFLFHRKCIAAAAAAVAENDFYLLSWAIVRHFYQFGTYHLISSEDSQQFCRCVTRTKEEQKQAVITNSGAKSEQVTKDQTDGEIHAEKKNIILNCQRLQVTQKKLFDMTKPYQWHHMCAPPLHMKIESSYDVKSVFVWIAPLEKVFVLSDSPVYELIERFWNALTIINRNVIIWDRPKRKISATPQYHSRWPFSYHSFASQAALPEPMIGNLLAYQTIAWARSECNFWSMYFVYYTFDTSVWRFHDDLGGWNKQILERCVMITACLCDHLDL